MMSLKDEMDSDVMKYLKKAMTVAGFSDEEQDQIIAKADEMSNNPKFSEQVRGYATKGSGRQEGYRAIIDSHMTNMLSAAEALNLHPDKFMLMLYVHVKDMVVQTFGEDRLNAFESCITTLQGETHVDS